MNREETRNTREVMYHFETGGEVQRQYRDRIPDFWNDDPDPVWNHVVFRYRRKPEATIRPWTMEECPVGEVVMDKGASRKSLIGDCGINYVMLVGGVVETRSSRDMTYGHILENYTFPNGSPCGVREEGES